MKEYTNNNNNNINIVITLITIITRTFLACKACILTYLLKQTLED